MIFKKKAFFTSTDNWAKSTNRSPQILIKKKAGTPSPPKKYYNIGNSPTLEKSENQKNRIFSLNTTLKKTPELVGSPPKPLKKVFIVKDSPSPPKGARKQIKKVSDLKWFGTEKTRFPSMISLKIGNEIGKGSFAVVYEGYDSINNKEVAIKAISKIDEQGKLKKKDISKEV